MLRIERQMRKDHVIETAKSARDGPRLCLNAHRAWIQWPSLCLHNVQPNCTKKLSPGGLSCLAIGETLLALVYTGARIKHVSSSGTRSWQEGYKKQFMDVMPIFCGWKPLDPPPTWEPKIALPVTQPRQKGCQPAPAHCNLHPSACFLQTCHDGKNCSRVNGQK
eukprot:873337-Pelagomonas_calceolata.AAC.6